MSETVIFPAPNWYFSQCFIVSADGWLIYGIGRGLNIASPLENTILHTDCLAYNAQVIINAHKDKVASVCHLPTWSTSKLFVSGGNDGVVKLWSAESLLSKKAHKNHELANENVIAVSCFNDNTVFSVGNAGLLVVWNIAENICKEFRILPKNAKPSCMKCCPHEAFSAAIGTKSGLIYIVSLKGRGVILCNLKLHDNEISNLDWSPTTFDDIPLSEPPLQPSKAHNDHGFEVCAFGNTITKDSTISVNDVTPEINNVSLDAQDLDVSNFEVENDVDETFNIYEDFDANEFGHKKYQPEDIVVKKPKNSKCSDFLEDCAALKNDILSLNAHKAGGDSTSIVDINGVSPSFISNDSSLEYPHTDNLAKTNEQLSKLTISNECSKEGNEEKHLLAAIDLYGKATIWNMSGKLLGTGVCSSNEHRKSRKAWATLCWATPECIVATDHSGQIFSTNPNKKAKGKLKWIPLHHYHTKTVFGLAFSPYCKSSYNGKINTESCYLWSSSKDRKIICYSLSDKKLIRETMCTGGFITCIVSSQIDPLKFAIGSLDGFIIIWNMEMTSSENTGWGKALSHWQGIQSRILSLQWHPKKENILAFSTTDGRVGLMNTNSDKYAITLHPAFVKSVYEISWSMDDHLYACGGGVLKVYDTSHPKKAPEIVEIKHENEVLSVISFHIGEKYITIGTYTGFVALATLEKPHDVIAISYVCSKEIFHLLWHPKGVSNEDGVSPYTDWLAVCASDDSFVILKAIYEDKIRFETVCVLNGHSAKIKKLIWSPHHNARIMSISEDTTVHVWDVLSATIISTFSGHLETVSSAAWCPFPEHSNLVISAGIDMALRIWDINAHPPNTNSGLKRSDKKKKTSARQKSANAETIPNSSNALKHNANRKQNGRMSPENIVNDSENLIELASHNNFLKSTKKTFMLISQKQYRGSVEGCTRMLRKHMTSKSECDINLLEDLNTDESAHNMDYLKLFGNYQDVMELLNLEQEKHLEFNRFEEWSVLGILKGEIDLVLKLAVENNTLDTFLLTLAPAVSHRFWKEMMLLYGSKIISSTIRDQKLPMPLSFTYGGIPVQKALVKLAIQDVEGAVNDLVNIKMYKEAIALARIRHFDDLANSVLLQWADNHVISGIGLRAAEIYLSLGDLNKALDVLRRAKNDEYLNLMLHLARCAGNKLFADVLLEKKLSKKESAIEEVMENTGSEISVENESAVEEAMANTGSEISVKEESAIEEEMANTGSEISVSTLMSDCLETVKSL